MDEPFKRINFFKGFFTTAKDWNDAQDYHVKKRAFHNQFFHTPGVARGLTVHAIADGTAVSIEPGYAIDGRGQDLYLPDRQERQFIPQKYTPRKYVYVVIKYQDEPVDPRPGGNAYIREYPTVDITQDVPDNKDIIELARINFEEVNAVRDALDPNDPKPNEIDTRYTRKAGSRARLADFGELVLEGMKSLVPSTEPGPSANDPSELIESIDYRGGHGGHRFYLVSAYPSKKGPIHWRIESVIEGGRIKYMLYFKNWSGDEEDVFYHVYRLS